MPQPTTTKGKVAVIGAGPAGLVMARWLIAEGFQPVVFEAADRLGGQWNPACATSATWAGMRTNTSRLLSRFSDLDHALQTPLFPRREDMLAYLERYASEFGLTEHLRLSTRVSSLSRTGADWTVLCVDADGDRSETFSHVVLASGAENRPVAPAIAGQDSFTGRLGIIHSAHYPGADCFRGRSVLVAGCSISALEIASELALSGATVTVSYRRQRYVLPKLVAGVPTDHIMFTRAAAEAGATLVPDQLAAALKNLVTQLAGRPDQFGAPAADENIFAAGITQAQHFLPAVAEGRITVKPWLDRIARGEVIFRDGTRCAVDGIILGTGYHPDLDILPADIATCLGGAGAMDLYKDSFHPALPGLAFLGLYNLVGPKLPVLELQARWVAQVFAGQARLPPLHELRAGVAEARARRGRGELPVMHGAALSFAALAGVAPRPERWPELADGLTNGPLSPTSFRLEGPASCSEAPQRLAREFAAAFV